jgi:hypothetical protein
MRIRTLSLKTNEYVVEEKGGRAAVGREQGRGSREQGCSTEEEQRAGAEPAWLGAGRKGRRREGARRELTKKKQKSHAIPSRIGIQTSDSDRQPRRHSIFYGRRS